ncbi:MAG: L,D-transpeptidase [Hapalosiphonaceae cyanobacterium JJU2]|nr:MAG: L,D-transpeptidase [Hapalosiphonaceae cyanobacterium JJU2]
MGNWIGSSWVAWLTTFLASVGILCGAAFTSSDSQTKTTLSHFSYRIFDRNSINEADIWKELRPPRKIEIDLSKQRLYAWEGSQLVYSMRVSTGKRSTPTKKGKFVIGSKHRSTRMRGPGYDISGVPYTMYFYEGYAIHGAFWHSNFGTPVSHGCVNLPVKEARKLFNWADLRTVVVVHK